MSKLKDYEFSAEAWPPPKNMQNRETNLIGFDSDYQPYLLRYETKRGSEGWCAVSLQDSTNRSDISASPVYFDGKDVHRRILHYSELPLRKSVINKELVDKYAYMRNGYCGTCGHKH